MKETGHRKYCNVRPMTIRASSNPVNSWAVAKSLAVSSILTLLSTIHFSCGLVFPFPLAFLDSFPKDLAFLLSWSF